MSIACWSRRTLILSRRSGAVMSSSSGWAFGPISAAIASTRSLLRAARVTCAPLSASRRAIASPMPRDAPVTSAFFPLRSMFMRLLHERLDRRYVADVHHFDVRIDAADEPRQHVLRPDLDEKAD